MLDTSILQKNLGGEKLSTPLFLLLRFAVLCFINALR